ncbi:MAG: glycosyltransferase family 39 protein [Candidatus Sulfotelmatobacter sp.]
MAAASQPGRAADRRSDYVAMTLVGGGLLWRLWLAHATFFNSDEAWHFSIANQASLYLAYKASLTLLHPPLLVLVLYFWRGLGTSNLVLRLPCVIAGTLFCWVFWRWLTVVAGRTAGWVGLILVTFLPPMIALSADLRQYTLMLLFATSAAYFLERALAENLVRLMEISTVFLYLSLLSHYSAFLFAAALGVYCILRMFAQPPSPSVIVAWGAGQAGGVGLGWFLYTTQIAALRKVYPGAQPLHRYADFYLFDYYFHPGRNRLLPFLYHGSFGVFRFIFGQTTVGDVAALMFVAGALLLLCEKPVPNAAVPSRLTGLFLLLPFVLNCAAVAAGLYPYGRTRQCVFLAIFGIAGVSVLLAKITKQRTRNAVLLVIGVVVLCQAFGTLQGRDMLPLADQRHEHMEQAIGFIRQQVGPSDLIFVDEPSRLQLGHYLCRQEQISIDRSVPGFESFRCRGFRVTSTDPDEGAFTRDTFADEWQKMLRAYSLKPGATVWVFEGGWASGLGEALRNRSPEFSGLEPQSFGHFLELFKLKVPVSGAILPTPAESSAKAM